MKRKSIIIYKATNIETTACNQVNCYGVLVNYLTVFSGKKARFQIHI